MFLYLLFLDESFGVPHHPLIDHSHITINLALAVTPI